MTEIDETDRQLLRKLQADATLSLEQLAAAVHLSTNSVWRRIKRLEKAGVICGRVAVLNPCALGLDLTVFVTVRTNDHSLAWLDAFRAAAAGQPEIGEIYRMAGETDYLLKLRLQSIADYDRVYKRLIASVSLGDVSAHFAMETIKQEHGIPL